MVLTNPVERVVRKRTRRDPKPRFKPDISGQPDPIFGCPEAMVPAGHPARVVRDLVAQLDLSALEAQYSSLGCYGHHPRHKLAVWVYATQIGLHEATKVSRACQTDLAFRLLSGGYSMSTATLGRFPRENREFFEQAVEQTVAMAQQRGLLDTSDLSVDSMRLRAHASPAAVRTVKRSTQRVKELAAVNVDALDEDKRKRHEASLAKHQSALQECKARGRTSIVATNESAALMKFPNGASAPGHRITVTLAGMRQRLVVGVLVDAATTDHGKLGPALEKAREVLKRAGVPDDVRLQVAADAGYTAIEDYAFAAEQRDWVDVLVPVADSDTAAGTRKGYFGREHFKVVGERATCPAEREMVGPYDDGDGRKKWMGAGCGDCALKPRCTKGRRRALTLQPELERVREQMRKRMQQPGARQRYNRRIATVEPVFASLESVMGFRRASSRHARSVVAEVLLKILTHNLARLASAARLFCVWCSFETYSDQPS